VSREARTGGAVATPPNSCTREEKTVLDLQALREGRATLAELVADCTPDNLRAVTDDLIERFLALIAGCTDADVSFEPVDPCANDPFAATPDEVRSAWTLGHVIVHTTATAEESAGIAAELARGVACRGRSRHEVPWSEMRTIEGCRQRLQESRRMRTASLSMWPDAPYLENRYRAWEGGPQVNAIERFVLGLVHEESHLGQVAEIARQARAARGGGPGAPVGQGEARGTTG
jgi:hypothetical protein